MIITLFGLFPRTCPCCLFVRQVEVLSSVAVMISVCTVQHRQGPVLHASRDDVALLVQVWLPYSSFCANRVAREDSVPSEGGLAVDVPRAERLLLSLGAQSWRHPGAAPARGVAVRWGHALAPLVLSPAEGDD